MANTQFTLAYLHDVTSVHPHLLIQQGHRGAYMVADRDEHGLSLLPTVEIRQELAGGDHQELGQGHLRDAFLDLPIDHLGEVVLDVGCIDQ